MFDMFKNVDMGKLVIGMVVLAFSIFLISLLEKRKKIVKKGDKATTIRVFLGILRAIIIVTVILMILQILGFDISTALAGFGIAGVVLGFALQDIIKDVINGIRIIFEKFFNVGDGVVYEGEEGVITAFTITTTKIELNDSHDVISVCNRYFDKIRVLSKHFDIDIPISYKDDTKNVYEIFSKINDKIKNTKGITESNFLGIQSFEASSVLYRIRVYCEAEHRADLRRTAKKITYQTMLENGIEIPFNQLDIHTDK